MRQLDWKTKACYKTLEEAKNIYKLMSEELFGEFASK